MLNGIINNIAFLIILIYFYSFLYRKQNKMDKNLQNSLNGILFGIIAVCGMLIPINFSNGIIFDGRSIVLSIAAFLGGPIVAVISVIISSIYRIIIGGNGTIVGVGVIFTSSIIGLLYKYLMNEKDNRKLINLYFLGIVVHVAMLLWMLVLPGKSSNNVIIELTIPILIVYPIATVIIAKILIEKEFFTNLQLLLANSEEKYKLLVENNIDLIVKIDLEGNFHFANSWFCKTFEVTEKEILGKNFISLVHPDDIENMLKAIQMLQLPPFNFYKEQRIKIKNEWHWFYWNYKLIINKNWNNDRIIVLGRDITDKKNSEELVKEREERLKLFIKNSNDIFILVNKNGEQIFISEVVLKYTGFEAKELLLHFENVIHPDDIALVKDKWKEVLENKDRMVKVEYRHIHKTKGYVWFESFAQSYIDNPLINAVIVNVRDITERKKVEDEIKKTKDNLVEMVEEKTKELTKRIAELEHFYNVTIEREIRMQELREEIALLKKQKNGEGT